MGLKGDIVCYGRLEIEIKYPSLAMIPQISKLADFRTFQTRWPGQMDMCDLDDKVYQTRPTEARLTLTGQDFQWAQAAIKYSRSGALYIQINNQPRGRKRVYQHLGPSQGPAIYQAA